MARNLPPPARPVGAATAPRSRPSELITARASTGATVFPTAPAQRRLYYLHQLAPDSPAYNVPLLLTVRGDLELDRLERALRALRLRHEVLRTTFETRGEDIVQLVHAGDSGPAVLLRLAGAEGVDLEARRAWAVTEAVRRAEQPFDLQQGPLWSVDVLEVSPAEHVVLFTFHHIIVDELSVHVLAADLEQLYEDERALEGVPTGPQYADFCIWQQQQPAGPSRLEYWRRHLADLEPQRLPEDGTRRSDDPFAGDQVIFELAPPLDSLLEESSRRLGASPFMLLLGALAVVLHRWTGQSDIALGTIITNRPEPELAHTVGFFSNTVVLRCPVTPDTSFRGLLTSVRRSVLGAIEHQDVPFESVVEAIRPRRDASRNPLFQGSIAYNRQRPESVWRLPGLAVEPLAFPWHSSQFGFTLVIIRDAGGALVGDLCYSTAQLSRPMAEQLAESFMLVLRHFLERPESLVSEAPLLSEATRQRVLEPGSGGEEVWTGPASVWDLFAALAEAQAGKEALRAVDGSLTFAELRSRAEAWGAALKEQGIEPEVVVGIHLPRRAALVTAMFATWRAGGAFLLLDPAAPPERLRMLARDAGVSLLLVDDEAPHPFDDGEVPVLPISRLSRTAPASRASASRTTGNELAYVMFTSGSTGRPKGVMIEQRSLVAHALTQLAPSYADAPPDRPWRVAALCAVTFDVFINQFLALAALGHTLVLLSEEEREDPIGLLRRNTHPDTALDVLESSTSQLEVLVEAGLLETPYPPALLRFGGESVSPRLWERLQRAPRTRAFNVYGVTECTICTTRVDVRTQPTPVAGRAVGVGRLYIVDERGHLLPPGFAGEVCIGGEVVGRGYLGLPELTRERFVPDPFRSTPGARMYRTGDRGRLRHDGQLEFLGRMDDQLKVRGFRIEPGEVETALCAQPSITQAAIVATTASGEGALVAFVVPAAGAGPGELTTASVREFLKRRLPATYLPDRLELLETLPLTRNGKVDREALRKLAAGLPTAATSGSEARVTGERPATPTETALCRLFEELLGVPQVRLDDDFFELGGHSLLAIRAVFRIARELGHPITVGTFLAHPTPALLAAHLSTRTSRQPTGLVHLRRGEGTEALVLFHPVGGTLACYEPLVRALPAGPTVLGCERVHGAHEREESLDALAERYAKQVLLAAPKGPLVLGGWSLGGVLAYLVAGRLLHHGREVHRIELIDAQAVRRQEDRDALRATGQRLRELAAEVRSTRLTRVLGEAPDAAPLLAGFGVRPADFLQLEPDEAAALMEDWAHLLVLGAEVTLSSLPVPTRLLVCEGNPSHSVQAVRESWVGLCVSLTVEPVPGDHASVLLAPAVATVARALAGRAALTALTHEGTETVNQPLNPPSHEGTR